MTRPLRPSLLITLLTVLLIGAFGAGPAAAHSELVSSSPANGSSGPGKPTEVQLTFNEDISTTGLQVVAQGSAGAVALGTPTVSGAVVSAAWPQSAPAGTYTVSYRVVSADGHPVDGSISFTYADLACGSGAPARMWGARSLVSRSRQRGKRVGVTGWRRQRDRRFAIRQWRDSAVDPDHRRDRRRRDRSRYRLCHARPGG